MVEQEKPLAGQEKTSGTTMDERAMEKKITELPIPIRELIKESTVRLRRYGKLSEEELEKECRARTAEIISVYDEREEFWRRMLNDD